MTALPHVIFTINVVIFIRNGNFSNFAHIEHQEGFTQEYKWFQKLYVSFVQ